MEVPDAMKRAAGNAPSPLPRNAADQNFFGTNPTGDERGSIEDSYFKLPKTIVVLGWGSLVWDPDDLPIVVDDAEHPEAAWSAGGPELPIEFSRVAVDCRLIPVLDPVNGVPVKVMYARSRRNDLDAAIVDLMKREGSSNPKRIGFVDTKDDRHRCLLYPKMSGPVKEWAKQVGVDCAIWTELPSNFKAHYGRDFTLDNALSYLKELPHGMVEQAREYVNRAPASIDTPLRQKLNTEGWPL